MQSEFPKCPVCGLTSGYESSGLFGKYSKCLNCMTKWKLLVDNQRIVGLMLHELPKNGAALYKVSRTGFPLFVEIGKRLGLDFWKNLELDGKIDWRFLSKNVDKSISNYFVKEDTETLLHSWAGRHSTGMKREVYFNAEFSTEGKDSGVLLLTSQRLIFFRKPLTGVALDIRLPDIVGISGINAGSYIFLSVVDGRGEHKFWLDHTFLELVKPMIENAIMMRRGELEAERKKDKVHVLLDFSFLRDTMEKGGLTMQALKCPECGASMDFPKSGNVIKCTYCSKAIYAQDVFEKVKDLI